MNFRDAEKMAVLVVVLAVGVFGEVLGQNQVPTIIVPENSKQREKVRIDPEVLKVLKSLNEMFAETAALWSAKNYAAARTEYGKVLAMTDAPSHYKSYAHLRIAQSYMAEKNTAAAKAEYEKIKANAAYPEVHRYEAEECAKEIDRVAQGLPARDVSASRTKIPPVAAFAVEYFVAPTGNDANPGTKEKPFATLEKARDAIRALKTQGELPGPVGVRLMPGEYQVKGTLELTAADSGTEAAPIVYRADQKGTAVLYGGARLSGFTRVSDPAILQRLPAEVKGKVFQCDLRKLGIHDYGELTEFGYGCPLQPTLELHCDGKQQTLARWPNEGFVNAGKIIEPGSVKEGKPSVFEYLDDRHARWAVAEDAWLYGYFKFNWADRALKIRHIDAVSRHIAVAPYRLHSNEGIGGIAWHKVLPYFAFNLLEELDAPGEWYLDRKTGILYFYPPSDPTKACIEIGMLSTPMVTMDKVSHVRMEGLVFDLTRFHCALVNNSERCLFAACTVKRIPGEGFTVKGGKGNGILGCDFHHIGATAATTVGGERKTLTPAHHFVENCQFHSNRGTAVAIDGVGNRVAHNLFFDLEGSAVYGKGGLIGNDHVIEYNVVHRACIGAGADTGAMGSFGDPTYRVVYRYNLFSNIGIGQDGGRAAIRLDDAISGMVIYGNIFHRCGDKVFGALQYNSGRDNIADNNVFIECPKVQTGGYNLNNKSWDTAKQKGTVADPLYLARYPDLKHVFDQSGFNHLWRNVYWNCPLLIRPGYQVPLESFDVMDAVMYTTENPGFVDVANEDFRLKPDAAVFSRIGFRPIPVEEIGLYNDEYRATWPAGKASVGKAGGEGRRTDK